MYACLGGKIATVFPPGTEQRNAPALRQKWPWRGFSSRREADVVWYTMSVRSTGLACIISLMVLGCASNPPVSASEDARVWQEEKERQQQGDREAGRIGYIGNEGPPGE